MRNSEAARLPQYFFGLEQYRKGPGTAGDPSHEVQQGARGGCCPEESAKRSENAAGAAQRCVGGHGQARTCLGRRRRLESGSEIQLWGLSTTAACLPLPQEPRRGSGFLPRSLLHLQDAGRAPRCLRSPAPGDVLGPSWRLRSPRCPASPPRCFLRP